MSLRTESLTPLHWAGIALAAATGVIHLVLGASFIADPLGWAFLVATLGFLVGAVAVLVDYRRRLVYLLGVPFTAGQIVLWYVVNAPDFSPLGVADKVAQVLLIVVLVMLYRRES
jgi:hypothetical protein